MKGKQLGECSTERYVKGSLTRLRNMLVKKVQTTSYNQVFHKKKFSRSVRTMQTGKNCQFCRTHVQIEIVKGKLSYVYWALVQTLAGIVSITY